jgi:hypothetical protein
MHVVRVTGLSPGRAYAYAVRMAGKVVGEGRFTTAPRLDSGAPLKFLVYGDDRTDPVAHAAVARALLATASDFVVNTGDMVEDGGRAEDWQSFFDVESRLLRGRPIFVAIGNHELYDDRAGANFARYFGYFGTESSPRPYGTVRLSNVRFFFLNSMHEWASGEERNWLDRELNRADVEPGLQWRIVVLHQGPWSGGPHGGNAMLIRAHVPELLAAHHVDLLFAGHDHLYERGEKDGIKYVISGGGGAPLYVTSSVASTRKAEAAYHFVEVDTAGDGIRLVAHRMDGSLLDECGFGKQGSWDCDAPQGSAAGASTPTPLPSSKVSTPRCGCGSGGGATGAGGAAAVIAVSTVVAAISRRRRRTRA